MKHLRLYAPGLLLCAALAVPCWLLGHLFPVVGGPVFGILLGMIIALFWKNHSYARAGIGFTSKKILQCAVVLLGFGLNLTEIARVGSLSLPIIVSTITMGLCSAYVVCKVLKIPSKVATLIGVGSAICGGSAIAATAPVIKADDKDIAQAISVVFLFNVIAALIFPSIGGLLNMSNEGFALFAGTAINDTSSVTAAAAVWDELHPDAHALDQAIIVKLTRTLAIIPITFVLALWDIRQARKANQKEASSFSLKRAFPFFILFFVLASLITTLASLGGIDISLFDPLKTISKYFIIMAMIAIGLNTDLVRLVKSGGKPLIMGLCCCLVIAGVSIGAQSVFNLW